MRLVFGALVLMAVAIPQTLFAQASGTEASTVQAVSSSQAASGLQPSPARASTRLGVEQTALLLNLPAFRTDPGRYALMETSEGNKAPATVSSSEPSGSYRVGSKIAFRPTLESRKPPIKLWRTLLIVQHSAAVFDAWSTRDAIQNRGAHELNPLFRPFAGSNAIYAATQVGSGLFDYLGHRMMKSRKGWMRRLWWLPQVAGTVGSLFSGAHNLVIAQGRPPSVIP